MDDQSFPDQIPIVYTTGYKVEYKAGASALPTRRPDRTWWEWLTDSDYPRSFIAVGYRSNEIYVLKATPDGSIPNFVPIDFSDGGRVYRQLTPNGKSP